MIRNTRQFVEILRKENELLEITTEVDPYLELAEIQRQVVAQKGPAVLFKNVKGTRFPVVTNLYGSEKRIDLALGKKPENFIRDAVDLAQRFFPPDFKKIWEAKKFFLPFLKIGRKRVSHFPNSASLSLKDLPQIQCWPEDGGAFVTLPLVYTQSPTSQKSNLGMYRIQLYDEKHCGMHIQIHRGGGFHFHEAEALGQNLPVHIYVGGPPALTIAAILPLPEDVPEILFASLLMGERLKYANRPEISPLPILADADFCIVGEIIAGKRRPEGPFGDHYGYYSLQHDYPYVEVKHVLSREDAIYPATVVGRPPQEDHYIACYLQELLKPLIHAVMPQVKTVWAYEESGVHSLATAVVKDRYPREALTTALRILGEGQLSLSKVLMVTDRDCDVKNFETFFPILLERMDFATDLFVLSNISQDTLDYTGPKVNEGSKAVFLGVGEAKRALPKDFNNTELGRPFSEALVFCPGALAVTGPAYVANDGLAKTLAKNPALKDWPILFLFDDAKTAIKTPEDFIWHAFTRFEPAADIHAHATEPNRYHFCLTPPIVIDCRMKPWYPKVLESDPKVARRAAESPCLSTLFARK
jgi:UbiD family decarboxylase